MGRTFSRAVLAAAAAHVLAALALRAVHVPLVAALRATEPAAYVDITREVEPTSTAVAPAASATEHRGASTKATTEAATAPFVASATTSGPSADTGAPADAGWFDPVRSSPNAPPLLGRRLDVPAAVVRERAPRDDGAITAVRDALAAHDQSIGMGRAGPLQAAAHEAASAAVAPDTGVGQLEIDCDGDGHVVAVRTSQSTWQPVATRLARAMAGKTMRVRPGSHGLRMKLRIVAERTLPSGNSRVAAAAGGVPDDAPGAGKVCDGEGITRRCVAGMPVGATVTGEDLSDLGARPSRIVRVNVESETDL